MWRTSVEEPDELDEEEDDRLDEIDDDDNDSEEFEGEWSVGWKFIGFDEDVQSCRPWSMKHEEIAL